MEYDARLNLLKEGGDFAKYIRFLNNKIEETKSEQVTLRVRWTCSLFYKFLLRYSSANKSM